MDLSQKIKRLREHVRQTEEFIQELLHLPTFKTPLSETVMKGLNEDPNDPIHHPPLCMNRRKDYEEWIKECDEYEKSKSTSNIYEKVHK